MTSRIRNFGWDRVKLSTLSYEQLDQLCIQVEQEHACKNGIYLYDNRGLKKLDALSWAVYYKMKADRKAKEQLEALEKALLTFRAQVVPAEVALTGKRLRVAEGRYAAYFPQERPLDGAKIIAWDERGNLLGTGYGRDTRDTGIAIIVNGKKYDSNHVIHWCS